MAAAIAVAVAAGLYLTLFAGDGEEAPPVTSPSALRSTGEPPALSPPPAERRPEARARIPSQVQIPISQSPAAQSRPPAPIPQPLAEAYGHWRVRCALNIRSQETCRAEQVLRDDHGQPQLALIVHPGSQGKPAQLEIMPPWGISVQAGVVLQVDGGAALRTPLLSCQPSGCEAMLGLSDQLVASFSKAAEVKVSVISAEGQTLSTTLPLAGFADAYRRLTAGR
ncbi:MAG: invasion associated locus B family protein [Reyranellaceae bacterium]